MDLRWPRALVALLIVTGTAALGVGALSVGSAAAASCGMVVCPPPPGGSPATVAPGDTGGPTAIKTKWTVPSGYQIDSAPPSGAAVTIKWNPGVGPAGVPSPDSTTPVMVPLACQAVSGGAQECDAAWPSDLEKNGYVLNGTYSVSASARVCDILTTLICSPSTIVPASATVANPPVAPANVKAVLVGNAVTTTWDASPEPDVFGYAVRRSGTANPVGGCRLAFAPSDLNGQPMCLPSLSSTDSSPGGGDFTYTVTALRFGGSYAYDHRVEMPASATKKITVPGPPATTTVPHGPVGGTNAGFGVFNAPKVKPGSGIPTLSLDPRAPPGTTVGTVDPGFSPVLPYGPTTATTDKPTVAAAPVIATPKGKSSVKSIALVGAGVLVTVIAMHGLWLRSEVRRSGALEVLEPEL